jgi:hypothetical protein
LFVCCGGQFFFRNKKRKKKKEGKKHKKSKMNQKKEEREKRAQYGEFSFSGTNPPFRCRLPMFGREFILLRGRACCFQVTVGVGSDNWKAVASRGDVVFEASGADMERASRA